MTRGVVQRILSMWWITLALSVAIMLAISVSQPIVDLKITKAQQDLMTLQRALDDYKTKRGALPSEQDGLAALVGVSLSRILRDPWGSPYVYRRPGQDEVYRVYSRGLDGRDDGGAGDDVTTAAKTYRCADYSVNCPPTLLSLLRWSLLLIAVASFIAGLVQAAFSPKALKPRQTQNDPEAVNQTARERTLDS